MSSIHGSRLGPYEIRGSVGAGGMGKVFRARDTRLNRDGAMKMLPKDRRIKKSLFFAGGSFISTVALARCPQARKPRSRFNGFGLERQTVEIETVCRDSIRAPPG